MLAYLLVHRERLVAKQELLEQLWREQFVGETTLSSCIRAVRQAVGDTGQAQRVIHTLHGRGFRFVAEIEGDRQDQRESAMSPSPAMASPLAPPGSPVAGGPVWGPGDQEPGAPERLTATGVEAEHKAVTVLCASLVDATALASRLGPEATYRLMQACLATAQQVLPPYGGTLTHITGEGFVALFGAPLADEDHARRAVLAAVALQQALQARQAGVSPGVPLGIGVHAGPVVVGSLGAESHELYTAVGRDHRAGQPAAAAAAPGAILLSAATQQLVQAEVQVDDGGSIGVAGRRPRGRCTRCVDHAAAVGGAGAWGTRLEPLRRARAGAGDAARALAARHPGAGTGARHRGRARHRQVATALRIPPELRERPVTYGEGHCLAYGRTAPYLPVQDLLRQLCGIAETDSPEAITRKVHAHLHAVGHDARGRGAISAAGPGPGGRGRPTGPAQSQAIRARTFASLQQVCLASSRQQPLILAVENLHWSDPTSEEWLTALVERLAGAAMLLLVTYRPGYRPAWLAQSYATQLALPRLTVDDSVVLVQSVPQSRGDSRPPAAGDRRESGG